MPRPIRAALAVLLIALASPLAAQTESPAPPAAGAPVTDLHALIEALGDEATRAKLIEALEESAVGAPAPAAAEEAIPSPEPEAPTAPAAGGLVGAATGGLTGAESLGRANQPVILDPSAPSIGDRVLNSAPEIIAEAIADIRRDFRNLRSTLRRLGGLSDIDPADGWATVVGTLILVASSVGTLLLGRTALIPAYRRLARLAEEGSGRRRLGLGLLSVLLDLALLTLATLVTLFAALLVAAIHDGEIPPRQYNLIYAFAFFYAGALAIAIRAALSPRTHHLRPIPVGNETARYWALHLTVVIAIAVFGELFARQVVRELANPITANAVSVAFHVVGAVYLAILILRNRNGPVRWVDSLAEAEPQRAGLAVAAMLMRYWHIPALLAVGWILNATVTSGAEALPMLWRIVLVFLSLAAATATITILNHFAHRGVTLPLAFQRSIPNLGPRLNAFVPAFLRFLRYVVLMVWLGYAAQVLDLADPWRWFEARYGFDFAGAVTSLIIIVLVCYAAWLAVTSWIEYQLTPDARYEPTPRQQTLFSLLRNAALVGILLIGSSYALASFGISIAPLLASAGVVGLAIGFGSQKLVQDIINGLFIQFESAISVGDVVELGGQIGTAEKLTIRSVSLRDVQGVLHIIPFSSVDAVSNHTMGYSYHVADMSVAYGADLDRAKEEMLAAYDDLKNDYSWGSKLLGGIEWFGVQSLGANAVILRSRIKTRPGEQWGVGRAYAERVKRRFDAAGIEIPFPQMKLWYDRERPPPGPLGPLTPPRPSGGLTDADSDGR